MTGPTVVRTPTQADAALERARACGTVGLVPTMGALHDGHGLLLSHAASLADTLVASIFVNPTQFGPGEDFGVYPRSFDADLARCAVAGVDVVYAPGVEQMYPDGPDVDGVAVDPGPLGAVLEGAARPTHFRGVLTVVAKLFGMLRPDVAVFGEKDYQQLVLIRQMAEALAMPVEIAGAPIARAADGLAVSSRNAYLDAAERTRATALSQAVAVGAEAGPEGADAVLAATRGVLAEAGVEPEYVAVTGTDLGEPEPYGEARLLVTAIIGGTRLLDNARVDLGGVSR